MLSGASAPNKTRKQRLCGEKETPSKNRRNYRKAGIRAQASIDDSSGVNVHGALPIAWVKLAMLLLNLAVWIDAAAQVAR
jgi:hypothetical protein